MRWAFDAGDPQSVAEARRSLTGEIARHGADPDDLFAVELLIGETLAAEMERGRIALVVELDFTVSGPVIHLWDQGPPFDVNMIKDELRRKLLATYADLVDVSSSDQGNHIEIRLPVQQVTMPGDAAPARLWKIASQLVVHRSRRIADEIERTTPAEMLDEDGAHS